jgi:RsiW-degrading membrane proteinase PrsW (M82 family)
MYVLFLFPVILFIVLLLFLDSFKLIKASNIIICSAWGLVAAWLALLLNSYLMGQNFMPLESYSKYVAPVLEEFLKIFLFVFLIKKARVGFMIDGAIYGFSTGAFFSVVENYLYFTEIRDVSPMLWVVRGFGTALMHGGTTAIIMMFAMGSLNTKKNMTPGLLKGYLVAVIIHSLFNHIVLLFSPIVTTVIIVLLLPTTIILVFMQNEGVLKHWLDIQLAEEVTLLKMIRSGKLSHTKTGEFIISIRNNFPPEVLLDMMNYIGLYTELSIHAKKVMLLKETGLPIVLERHVRDKLKELKALKHIIGKTGLLAISPILRMSQKDIWKLNLLDK